MTASEPAVPLPAATVVLLRPAPTGAAAEVLLIHRPGTMSFGPGLHAFPGGRVDAGDAAASMGDDPLTAAEAADRLGGIVPAGDALALHRAVTREAFEEVGVALRASDLVPVAQWTTPRFMARRFATWFFVADLPDGADPIFATDEVAAHAWLTPADALEARADGRIEMWIPTTSVLERLRRLAIGTAADARAAIRIRRPEPPRIVEETESAVTIAVDGAGGLPGQPGRVRIIGRRDVVVVDPGDPSEVALDAILAATGRRRSTIRAVVLTAPDPDRVGGAEAVATPLSVPILVAPGAGRWLPHESVELADGERLPTDVGARVRLGPRDSGELEVVASAGE